MRDAGLTARPLEQRRGHRRVAHLPERGDRVAPGLRVRVLETGEQRRAQARVRQRQAAEHAHHPGPQGRRGACQQLAQQRTGRRTGAQQGLLGALGRVRTLLTLGFPLSPTPLAPGPDALVAALTRTLTGAEALEIFRTWSLGQVRYRLAWARGGHRRSVVWRVAEAVGRACPELVNDPSASPWEVVVDDMRGALTVELRPRWTDERFAYRRGDVPAASHPTIAAALAQLAGVRADDVVWDPFVGSGLELAERLGPQEGERYRSLRGRYPFKVFKDRKFVATSGLKAMVQGVCAAAGTRNIVYDLRPA